MSSVLLCDFSSVFAVNWHATSGEELSAARERTVSTIRRHGAAYEHVGVCLDAPTCFRKAVFPAYKAQREAKPESYREQLRLAIGDVRRAGLRVFEAPDFEGDDVIATMAGWAVQHGHAVTILGTDKDLFQLLGPNVELLNHQTGVVVDVDTLLAKRGITPAQVPDYLALVGDTSDNLPGVRMVGAKRAAELLGRWRSLEGIYEALRSGASEFKPAIKLALEEARPSVFQVRELAKLRADVPIDCEALLRPATIIPETEEPDMSDLDEERGAIEAEAEVVPDPRESGPAQTPVAELPAPKLAADAFATPGNGSGSGTKALAPAQWSTALEPTSLGAAWKIAQAIVTSRMFTAYGRPESALLVIMAGREFGLGVMASLRSFHIVDGKPTMSAQLMMAKCLQHRDLCKMFRVLRSECNGERAACLVQRTDWEKPERYDWTIEDARAANLLHKNNWKGHARSMLINRCIAEAARFTWPELMANVYLPDELGADIAA